MLCKWEPVDTQTVKAILQKVTGRLRCKKVRKHESVHAVGETRAGRADLWSLHQRFKIERGEDAQVSRLMSL